MLGDKHEIGSYAKPQAKKSMVGLYETELWNEQFLLLGNGLKCMLVVGGVQLEAVEGRTLFATLVKEIKKFRSTVKGVNMNLSRASDIV